MNFFINENVTLIGGKRLFKAIYLKNRSATNIFHYFNESS